MAVPIQHLYKPIGLAACRIDLSATLLLLSFCLLFNCLTFIPATAQSPTVYTLEMQKNFISWNWLMDLNTQVKTGNKSVFSLHNRFVSHLFEQSAAADKWRDENTLQTSWQLPLAAQLTTRSFINSRILSDENTLVDFSKHLIGQELQWQAHPKIKLTPAIGFALEEAFNNNDQAWYSSLGLKINRLDMGGYLNSSDLNSVIRAFPDRQNQEHTFFTGWNKRFSDFASDSIRIGYQFSESRYYLSPGANDLSPLEKVSVIARFLSNQLNYQTSKHSFLSLLTNFRSRAINQINPSLNNLREEVGLENQVQFVFAKPKLQWQTGILFSQNDNDNPGVNTDVNTLQASLSQRFVFSPNRKNRIWSNFNYTKYEFNTPDAVNEEDRKSRDDRDELRFTIDLGYRHQFSEYYALTLRSNAYLYHQIYIRSGRSSRNNWNRILQLSGLFEHILSDQVQHGSQIKILANYTIFDFDELLPTVNSFLFRKLVYSDSLNIKLTPALSFRTIYQYETEDNGRFFKEEFAQQVTKEQQSHFLTVNLHHKNIAGLEVTSGLSWYLRDEWGFRPERQKSRQFRSITPRLIITYRPGKRLLLYAYYAPTRTSNFGAERQYFTTGTLNLRYQY